VAAGRSRATHAEHATSYTDFILCVAYSPDGALLAATNLGYYPARRERTVYIWRTTDESLAYTLGGFRYQVYAVAFTADGALLAVGGDDRWVKLYDVQSGEERGPTLR
jgi:WD40 repeat protein